MEALEVDAVVDDGQARRGHRVVARDLAGTAARDRDDLRRAGEDATLERERHRVVQSPSRRRAERLEVRAVTAFARAIDVLDERALVTLNHVPAASAGDHGGGQRQRHAPSGRRQRWQPQRMLGDAGLVRLPPRAGTVHVVSVRDQRPNQPRGRALHPAVKRERARDDQNAHQRCRIAGAPATRWSISG